MALRRASGESSGASYEVHAGVQRIAFARRSTDKIILAKINGHRPRALNIYTFASAYLTLPNGSIYSRSEFSKLSLPCDSV